MGHIRGVSHIDKSSMTFTYGPDPDILPFDLHAQNQVRIMACPFSCASQTHRSSCLCRVQKSEYMKIVHITGYGRVAQLLLDHGASTSLIDQEGHLYQCNSFEGI